MLDFLSVTFKAIFYKPKRKKSVVEVARYYDTATPKYLDVVDSAIQSHRTAEEPEMFDYYLKSMGIKDGMRLVDAGCGVCGPAVYFALKNNIMIDALTNSQVQVHYSEEKIKMNDVSEKVSVIKGDYHNLDKDFASSVYDVVYFLESYGHAYDHRKVLNAAAKLLKPGGIIYIKDYFKRDIKNNNAINKISRNMNKKYVYNLPDLYFTVHILRQLGFEIVKIGTPGFVHDNGEKAIEFERNNNIDLFGKYKKLGRIAYADILELIFRKV